MPIAICVIEDDDQTREVLAGWISSVRDFRLAGDWANAESALAWLPKKKPDVVLMDINLPGLGGVEAVVRLKRHLPATQFIMLTVYEDADHIFNALAAGAVGYLLKTTPRENLLAAIEEVHRGGSPMTCKIARKVVQSFWPGATGSAAGETLSPRERQVLDMLARGYLYKEIADALQISVGTVNTHARGIYEKLQVHSRGQAIAKYTHAGRPE